MLGRAESVYAQRAPIRYSMDKSGGKSRESADLGHRIEGQSVPLTDVTTPKESLKYDHKVTVVAINLKQEMSRALARYVPNYIVTRQYYCLTLPPPSVLMYEVKHFAPMRESNTLIHQLLPTTRRSGS